MKIKKIVTAALVLAVMLLAATVEAGVREDLLQLINAERVSLGKSALTFDSRLDAAAQDHSDDMLAKGFFDHNSQDGRTPGDRIKDEGFYGSWGENIYAHTGTPNAQRVFNGWKNSPGHYANMINATFNVAGIGIAEGLWDFWDSGNFHSTVYTLDLGKATVTCYDRDADGVTTCAGDCNDDDRSVHPGAAEVPYDGIDQDCSGADLTDVDKDGYAAEAAGGTDCDDTDLHVHPGAVEIDGDFIDNDCDGVVDTDGGDFQPTCTTDRNKRHVRARRAFFDKNGEQGKGYYARGSGQFLGKKSKTLVELKEVTPDYYEEGRCQPFPICTSATLKAHLRARRVYFDKKGPQGKGYYVPGSDAFMGKTGKTVVELKETALNYYEAGCN
jgi:hypothetical protein